MIEIALEADEEWDSSGLWVELAHRAAEAAIAESAFPQIATSLCPAQISVLLTGDEQVRALNDQWRGKDRPTNVLSFPMADPAEFSRTTLAGLELLLGDIIIARGICEAEAAEKGITLEDHATHLLVHGTLHLLGYDHVDNEEADDMEAREIRALRRLGIANPYAVTS
ncbi:MAG TPA: rRNA maturation RNase YbeY [Sphingomicrobium sp.]|nr:rRNA maturation RNase YbeY [Sphingomicrobium sp.]